MSKLRLFLANVGQRQPIYPLASPPMGILYLAAYLRTKFDVEVRAINQREENLSYDELVDQAVSFNADVVGLGTIAPYGYRLAPITQAIRRALPKSLIAIGGPHCSSQGARALEGTAANALVVGEGERSFEMIIQRFLDGSDFSDVPGLHWHNADGEIVSNPGQAPFIEDLDTLPFPAYDLIDLKRYWQLQSMTPVPRRQYVALVSSRGCPYHCMWCHDLFGRRFRAHSAERVVDEIEYHVRKYGIKVVEFFDDVFNLDSQRVIQFSELIRKRNIRVKIAFPNAIRGDILTEETIDALVQAGTYFCSFALESGSPRIQEFTGKRLSIPKFLKAIEMTANKGVFTNGFMMLGFPTETAAEMQQTIDVAANSMLHTASFFTVTPFPGSRLYAYLQQNAPEKLANLCYNDYDFCRMPVNLSNEPDEVLFGAQRRANRQFFFKPSRIFRILRDFPERHRLPLYFPIFMSRLTKGFSLGKGKNA